LEHFVWFGLADVLARARTRAVLYANKAAQFYYYYYYYYWRGWSISYL